MRPNWKQFAISAMVGTMFSTVYYALLNLDMPRPVRIHLIMMVMGSMAFSLTIIWQHERNRRKRHTEVIGCLVHHVNNALTVITLAEHLPFDQRKGAVDAGLRRIRWALDQVVPQLNGEKPLEFENGSKGISGH